MFQELRFALYAIKKNIQNSAELRTSFLANIVSMAINNIAFLILWVFFVKSVGVINGWTAADIVGSLGFSAFCFGIIFSIGGGIAKLADYVASGSFDRFMLSPKNVLLRVATSSFRVSAIGDIVFGIVCLIIYGILIQVNAYQIVLILLLMMIAATVFLAALIAACSVGFLFPANAYTIADSLFQFFFTPSLFHGGAFQGGLRFFFTFLVPSLVIGTLPVEIVKNVSLEQLAIVSLVAVVWFFLSLKIFSLGVKKYESSNFMTFGN